MSTMMSFYAYLYTRIVLKIIRDSLQGTTTKVIVLLQQTKEVIADSNLAFINSMIKRVDKISIKAAARTALLQKLAPINNNHC